MFTLKLLALGAATGLMTGLTGASGVVIVVPILTLALGFSLPEAVGTSLIVDIVAASAIAFGYARHKRVAFLRGTWLAGGAVVGAQLGVLIATDLPEEPYGVAFGIGLVVMGLILFLRAGKTPDEVDDTGLTVRDRMWAIALGLPIGFITGLSGAGGGMLVLAVLVTVLALPIHTAIGTSSYVMAVSALSGAAGFAREVDVRIDDGLMIGLAAVIVGSFAASAANRMPAKALSFVGCTVFVIAGIAMTITYAATGGPA